jgi:hypothetical protein
MRGIVGVGASLALASCVLGAAAWADSPAPERPYVAAGEGGSFYFKMVPATAGKPAGGVAYEVAAEGADRPIWSVTGWYSHQTYLSFDGQHLVSLGLWSFAGRPSARRIGVSFYKQGKLVKEYSLKDLVVDPETAPKTVSFYHYLDAVGGIGPDLTTFSLTTCDGIAYTFDVKTGEIVSKKRVPLTSPLARGR